MTEYELLYLFGESVDRQWMLLNIWVGISFTYMALANIGSVRFSLVQVVVLSLLYVGFTIFTARMAGTNFSAMQGFHADLRAMQAEEILSTGAVAWLAARESARELNGYLFVFCTLCTFFSGATYLPYCYWSTKRANR